MPRTDPYYRLGEDGQGSLTPWSSTDWPAIPCLSCGSVNDGVSIRERFMAVTFDRVDGEDGYIERFGATFLHIERCDACHGRPLDWLLRHSQPTCVLLTRAGGLWDHKESDRPILEEHLARCRLLADEANGNLQLLAAFYRDPEFRKAIDPFRDDEPDEPQESEAQPESAETTA